MWVQHICRLRCAVFSTGPGTAPGAAARSSPSPAPLQPRSGPAPAPLQPRSLRQPARLLLETTSLLGSGGCAVLLWGFVGFCLFGFCFFF